MSEQLELEKPERHFEARYKYLADFSKHERSPNLRKHYNDSFSKRSNSQGRRSSCKNSNQRISSYKKSQESMKIVSRQFSPPCRTFNAQRQITQQFSPYDERVDKEEERLNKELMEENAVLRNQLIQAGQTIDSLKLQAAKKQNEIAQIKQMSQNDLRYFERLVSEMTNQIQIVLTKNRMLENQLVVVKAKLQEEVRRHEEQLRFDEERRKIDQFRKKEETRRHGQFRRLEEGRIIDDQRRNTPQPPTKRSVGKLVIRPTANNQQLGTSKIKIEEDSEQMNQSNIENTRIHENRIPFEAENKKSEEFIGCIKSMQVKIVGEQSTSLKDLWKWLKGIGHTHSCLKRWKAKATEASSYYTSEKLKDLIREACGYIQ